MTTAVRRTVAAEEFLGFDRVDVRVSSVALVEAFNDRLLPVPGRPV